MTDAVFFISFGGPEKREDIRPFLEIVTKGRRIPPERIDEVAHHYEVIGGKSPINEITNRQAEGLRKELGDTPVYVGNRNWHPFLEETIGKMASNYVRHAVGFPTAAHRCEASWERYLNAVEAARAKIGPSAPAITYVSPWFDHPLFIDAICERIREVSITSPSPRVGEGRDGGTPHHNPPPHRGEEEVNNYSFIFTAHSIPKPMAQGSRYVQELSRTAELVCAKLGKKSWKLAYTSRSGAPTDPWLEPDVCDEIRAQAKQGVKNILTIPIGFVADHVEVLFDLDVEAKEAAMQAGVNFYRAKTVGDHPLFIQMITDVVKKAAEKK